MHTQSLLTFHTKMTWKFFYFCNFKLYKHFGLSFVIQSAPHEAHTNSTVIHYAGTVEPNSSQSIVRILYNHTMTV